VNADVIAVWIKEVRVLEAVQLCCEERERSVQLLAQIVEISTIQSTPIATLLFKPAYPKFSPGLPNARD
jgi:hypothetical protein